MSTFKNGDIVTETDFIEKYTCTPLSVLTSAGHPQTILMVTIVLFSSQLRECGGRVYLIETWVFASEDPVHELDFRFHALAQIAH